MSELALAAFAAARDAHAVERDTRTRQFAAFRASFDEGAYRRDLQQRGLRWIARSERFDRGFSGRVRR